MSRPARISAFSLVELSIVLIILGLITGGILGGQSLIRASQLRSVPVEYAKYIAAVQTFQDKFSAIPGDMANATEYWGVGATGTDCPGFLPTGTETCDGNGNQKIDPPTTTSNESFRFWQHLANSGLIEGRYTGAFVFRSGDSSQNDNTTVGVNVPPSKVPTAGWLPYYIDGAWTSNDFTALSGNNLTLGSPSTGAWHPYFPIIKPEEAWNIDKKMDDGKPGTGKMLARYWSTCATGASSASDTTNAIYDLANNTITCALAFPDAF